MWKNTIDCGETRACRLGREWKWASQAELRRSLKLRSSETYDALESVCIGLRSIIWGTSSC
ncbi:unnamed protein product, partial [Vitis vinifera]